MLPDTGTKLLVVAVSAIVVYVIYIGKYDGLYGIIKEGTGKREGGNRVGVRGKKGTEIWRGGGFRPL